MLQSSFESSVLSVFSMFVRMMLGPRALFIYMLFIICLTSFWLGEHWKKGILIWFS